MKTNPNDNAFPKQRFLNDAPVELGLTKREYFAAMAIQGMLASGKDRFTINHQTKSINNAAVLVADAMLLALNNMDPIV